MHRQLAAALPAIALYRDRGFAVEREDPTAYPSLENSKGYVMHKSLR